MGLTAVSFMFWGGQLYRFMAASTYCYIPNEEEIPPDRRVTLSDVGFRRTTAITSCDNQVRYLSHVQSTTIRDSPSKALATTQQQAYPSHSQDVSLLVSQLHDISRGLLAMIEDSFWDWGNWGSLCLYVFGFSAENVLYRGAG